MGKESISFSGLTGFFSKIFLKSGPYLEYIRVSFQSLLAYRSHYLIGVLTYLIHVAVYYFIYKALYSAGNSINHYSLSDMVTYIAIGWISKSLYLNYLDQDIAGDIRNGKITIDLIKPIDYQLMNYARGMGQTLFRLVIFTPPILIATFIFFPVHYPSSLLNLCLFIVSTFLSVLIYLGINFFLALIAVFTMSIEGILYPKNMMIELFSGLLVPIDWFPPWFQSVSSLLPFKYIAFIPLSLYLGKIELSYALNALFIQLLWVVIIFIAGRVMWAMCQKKIVIQGG